VAEPLSPEAFEASLGEAVRLAPADPRHGFVGPGSLTWRVSAEAVLHAAGPRALLMQFAHPLVAQGVFDHSGFDKDFFGRTKRTFGTVYRLVFGDRDEALSAARRIHRVHGRVKGTLPGAVGRHASGTPYHASDPELLLWVWATLVDSSQYAYDRWIAPLSSAEREAHYQEERALARLFGLLPEAFPPTQREFAAWIDERIAARDVAVGPAGRSLAHAFAFGRTGPPGLSVPFRVLAAGTLPAGLREDFGLPWDRRARAAFRALDGALRTWVRRVPRVLRELPVAREARRRCAVPS
jgi:uncharacterized protein (DUF2236 family)